MAGGCHPDSVVVMVTTQFGMAMGNVGYKLVVWAME